MYGGGFLFEIGDQVVYPMHGAGVIEAIEEKEILGKKQWYYVMKMPVGGVKIMLPRDQVSSVGLRKVVSAGMMDQVLLLFDEVESDSSIAWNQRYRLNMEKIKSGDVYKGAEVIRDLEHICKKRSLGTGDKKLLDDAKRILVSELALVKNLTEEQAASILDEAVHR
ncbi:CarD family transcriptional regulator [Desmospora profundinema]|uniref:CarD family transcriptional regulator n=1 Tax=Desmospora profundinema TaxID=1571184 RepID=A0ABU1II37_9BACL|nr:CarD family transcriptional regulator [Desmospora profundinema]